MICASEYKTCPRCHAPFECRVGTIQLCQCSKVELNDKERSYIRQHFDDCLCARCMQDMKMEYKQSEAPKIEDKKPIV